MHPKIGAASDQAPGSIFVIALRFFFVASASLHEIRSFHAKPSKGAKEREDKTFFCRDSAMRPKIPDHSLAVSGLLRIRAPNSKGQDFDSGYGLTTLVIRSSGEAPAVSLDANTITLPARPSGPELHLRAPWTTSLIRRWALHL